MWSGASFPTYPSNQYDAKFSSWRMLWQFYIHADNKSYSFTFFHTWKDEKFELQDAKIFRLELNWWKAFGNE